MSINDNLITVHQNIEKACQRCGRDPKEITLICVSKTKPVEMLIEAYNCNERYFGENKVQEIVAKKPLVPDDARFHMIGHLQTNKVKQLLDRVELIHSVDSYHLAEVISKEALAKHLVVDILIEVNIACEDSKYGINEAETEELVRNIAKLDGLKIRGLMTIAPFVDNPEENRVFFRKMHQLYVDLKCKNIDNTNINILSMGMTGDYEVAIEEGATMIRVGTGIFGARNIHV